MVNPDKIFGRLGNRMFQMAALYAYAKDNNTDIFFQDKKWFEKYAEEIKSLFRPGIPGLIDRVSIHFRRGKNPVNPDEPAYSDNPFYVDLAKGHNEHEDLSRSEISADLGGCYQLPNYYDLAIARFPTDKFLVFSDDLGWAKEYIKSHFDQDRFEFSEQGELEDFNLMAACKHNIIANSSFSWWAAYLNPNPDKIVIAPQAWYSDGVERTVCPKEWIRL